VFSTLLADKGIALDQYDDLRQKHNFKFSASLAENSKCPWQDPLLSSVFVVDLLGFNIRMLLMLSLIWYT